MIALIVYVSVAALAYRFAFRNHGCDENMSRWERLACAAMWPLFAIILAVLAAAVCAGEVRRAIKG